MNHVEEKLLYNQGDDDKTIVYAQGIIKHFSFKDSTPSLYFDGETVDGCERIRRNIKLSKRAVGYRIDNNTPLSKSEFPKKSDIYNGRVMLETWEWNGHNCKRVLAFELGEYLGSNDSYLNDDEMINPFSLI